jgi:hypothetical protein
VPIDTSTGSVVVGGFLIRLRVGTLVVRATSEGTAAFADKLLGVELSDILDKGCNSLTLAVADFAFSLDPRRGLLPCGSLAGDKTFFKLVFLDNGVSLGVVLFEDALRVGVETIGAPARTARARMGEDAAPDMGVLVARVLGVPLTLTSSGRLFNFFC